MPKKKSTKKTPKPKLQTFPPKFSTYGVRITGFQVQIWDHTPYVYEGEERKRNKGSTDAR